MALSWLFEEMELSDEDFMNLPGPANPTFEDDALRNFEFGAVVGLIDCRFSERDGKPFVEFSWQAKTDTDDVMTAAEDGEDVRR